jgi:hypothetical protein
MTVHHDTRASRALKKFSEILHNFPPLESPIQLWAWRLAACRLPQPFTQYPPRNEAFMALIRELVPGCLVFRVLR